MYPIICVVNSIFETAEKRNIKIEYLIQLHTLLIGIQYNYLKLRDQNAFEENFIKGECYAYIPVVTDLLKMQKLICPDYLTADYARKVLVNAKINMLKKDRITLAVENHNGSFDTIQYRVNPNTKNNEFIFHLITEVLEKVIKYNNSELQEISFEHMDLINDIINCKKE